MTVVEHGDATSTRGGEADPDRGVSPCDEEASVPNVQHPGRPYPLLTPNAYLVRERRAEYRSEYHDGEVTAMAGASERHVAIAQNVSAHLYFRLGAGCRVYQADLKVKAGDGADFVYPDVLVVCGEPRFTDRARDVVTNPAVVFEVLSPGTERHDRTVKARAYRRIESLAAYVLVSQKEPRVEVYARGEDGEWPCTLYQGIADVVRLDALGCELAVAEIYRNLFPARAA